ncbi:hypothetical protein ACI2L1_04910 [Streptomyces sp. NPDC019531]|uniref:hypothetical protein n=1 Tax=Streptomyces sp. NPDC019531 TaxID=3365062 RepID=UPI00384D63D4
MSKSTSRARLGRAALVAGSVGVLTPLPKSGTTLQAMYQPYFDYDSDSCFPAAVDPNGNANGGSQPVRLTHRQLPHRPPRQGASRHGGYSTHPIHEVPMNGTRPSAVPAF